LGDTLIRASELHPALIGTKWRRGRVGGYEAVATLVRLVQIGALSVGVVDGAVGRRPGSRKVRSVELRLVPGVTTPRRTTHGPFVVQGHVEGLHKLDRHLLSLLFDRVAHAPKLSLVTLRRFANEHPWQYWLYLKEWRAAVKDEASRQQLPRADIAALRREAPDTAVGDGRLDILLALGLDRFVLQVGQRPPSCRGMDVLLDENHGRPPLFQLKRLLSKRYPFGYSPPSRIGYTPVPSRAKGLIVRADEE